MKPNWHSLKYLVPNAFTALSLTCGVLSFFAILQQDFFRSAWLIIVAIFLDGADGKLARLLNAVSKFGVFFDTISDFFVFGFIPAILSYKIALHNNPNSGILIIVIYIFCGGFRLIRYTKKADKNSNLKKKFSGLPIPAAAGLIASHILINLHYWNELKLIKLHIVLIIFTSLLMISNIEYIVVNKKYKTNRKSVIISLLLIISIFFAIYYPYLIITFWILMYILYGIIRQIFRKKQ